MKLSKAALAWWENKRPEGWSAWRHSIDPIVNCDGKHEKRLARAVAKKWLEEYYEKKVPEDIVEPFTLSPELIRIVAEESSLLSALQGCFFKLWGTTDAGEYRLLCIAPIEINDNTISVNESDIIESGKVVRWRIDDEARPDIWLSESAGGPSHSLTMAGKYVRKDTQFNVCMPVGFNI